MMKEILKRHQTLFSKKESLAHTRANSTTLFASLLQHKEEKKTGSPLKVPVAKAHVEKPLMPPVEICYPPLLDDDDSASLEVLWEDISYRRRAQTMEV